jgi:tetratricopeptide (TPR) repeat protein
MFPAVFQSRLLVRMLLMVAASGLALALVHANDSDRDSDIAKRCRSHRLFGEALLGMKRRQWTHAESRLQEALQLSPHEPFLYRGLARCYLATDRLSAAAEAAASAARLDEGNYANWLLLAELERAQGQPTLATTSLKRAYACQDLRDQPELFCEVAKELANYYADAGDLSGARHIVQSWADVALASENQSGTGEAFETLARLDVRSKQFSAALNEFGRARDAYLGTEPARSHRVEFELAELCIQEHRPAKALLYLTSYLGTQPPGREPYELYIAALRAAGRADELPHALTEWIQRDPHNVALQLLYGRELVTAHKSDEAEKLYLAISTESATPEVFAALFGLYVNTGREKSAVAMLNRAIDEASRGTGSSLCARAMMAALTDTDLARRMIVPAVRGLSLKPATKVFLARLAVKVEAWDAAEQWLNDILETPGDRAGEGNLYECLLRVLWAERKLDRIVEICRKGLAVSQITNRLLFHENLTRALAASNRFDEALAEVDRAIALSTPEFRLEVRLLRIEILRLSDRLQQAESECLAVLQEAADPQTQNRGRLILAGIYTALQDYPEAEEQLRATLQADPEDPGANNDLGYLWADQGKKLAEAEAMIRRALAADGQKHSSKGGSPASKNAAFIDSLGWVLYRQGHLNEARQELEQAVALPEGKRDPVVADHLAEVYFQLGRRDDARQWWRRALEEYEEERSRRRGDAYDELRHKLELLELEPAKLTR